MTSALFQPLTLACGRVLKNRIAKSAMSDSLGDGRGSPTKAQMRLYERWAEGGAALSIVGEVQGDPNFAEKPGNLVVGPRSTEAAFRDLTARGTVDGTELWAQLGHAGAMAHPPISTPKGPSALDMPGLSCAALSLEEVRALPAQFARTARCAVDLGFGGVQIHAAHGFLLSQFLSPLFNKRGDAYGGPISSRMRPLMDVVDAVRDELGPNIPIAIKLNTTDQLVGGFGEDDALTVIAALAEKEIDLIDLSGVTYFPGAASASDAAGKGPYFIDFALRARPLTDIPLMVTGGFKTRRQAEDATGRGIDMIGLARALVLDPTLPSKWRSGFNDDPDFPKFTDPPEGGITAWYTMRLTEIGKDRETDGIGDLTQIVESYEQRDRDRIATWNEYLAT